MPPLNHSDLPPNPPPYNGRYELLVLAYPLSDGHVRWWTRKHNINDGLNPRWHTPHERIMHARLLMEEHRPRECKMDMVYLEDGDTSFAWWFATNKEKDLASANNLELINKVKKIIGAKGAPQWYELAFP